MFNRVESVYDRNRTGLSIGIRYIKKFPLDCDWVTGSGAEIRNRDGELLQTIPMDTKCFEQIVSCVEKFPAYIRFCTTGKDIVLTEEEDLEQKLLEESRLFSREYG